MFSKLGARPVLKWGLALIVLLMMLAHVFAPPRHVPWKPLDPNAPIGLATGTKITLLAIGPSARCMDKLSTAQGLAFTAAMPVHKGKCGYERAAKVTRFGGVRLRPDQMTAQCAVALGAYIWLNAVDQLAKEDLGSGLAKVHHAGTYSCRRQRGNGSGAWSEHAFANAWDITGFELKDGRVISVLKDWDGGKSAEAKARRKFLRGSKHKACRVFRVVLSPEYNAAHKDHFHLDQGPYLSCH